MTDRKIRLMQQEANWKSSYQTTPACCLYPVKGCKRQFLDNTLYLSSGRKTIKGNTPKPSVEKVILILSHFTACRYVGSC